MILVGLTGGIGAGKSTVARMLAERGATIVDADEITRELQQPGTPVFDAIVQRFGPIVVRPDGTLDRAALAAIVFSDAEALAELNAIVHPAVRDEMARRIEAASTSGVEVVVLDIPLIVESTGRAGMTHVITVEAGERTRVDRLVEDRGMEPADALARIDAQASRAEREAIADIVIDNDGDIASLSRQVDTIWSTLFV